MTIPRDVTPTEEIVEDPSPKIETGIGTKAICDGGFKNLTEAPPKKKPRMSSKTVNKDKDCCFRCHQHEHFAQECPQAQKDYKKETKELI